MPAGTRDARTKDVCGALITATAEARPAFACANGFTAYFTLLGERFLATIAFADDCVLTPGWAPCGWSGPHHHLVRQEQDEF
jgi:hypothetical protein